MKRKLIAIVASAAVFSGIYGLAASLGVSSSSLGAGSSAVAACQATPVTVSYTPTYDSTATAGYRSTTVTIDNLAASCLNKSFKVTLTGAGDSSLGEQTGSTPSSGTSQSLTFTGVAVSAVTGVHVTIYG
jgi:hypothetical protein